MVRAIRKRIRRKGYDVRESARWHSRRIPRLASRHSLCSLGLLSGRYKNSTLSRTKIANGEAGNLDDINEQFDNMVEQGNAGLLDKEGVPADRRYFLNFAVDMRYQRQNFEISIPVPAGKDDGRDFEESTG